jgi:hypothetical protein
MCQQVVDRIMDQPCPQVEQISQSLKCMFWMARRIDIAQALLDQIRG